jgi:hypothetical protein
MTGDIDLLTDTIKLMLVDGYAVSAAHEFRSDVLADEASGTGYTTGGTALTGKSLTSVSPITFDATNVDWQASSIQATGAILYKDTGNAATSPLIAYFPYSGTKISTDGEFFHEWSAGGILEIA